MNDDQDGVRALREAKALRDDTSAALAESKIRVDADAADLLACRDQVATLEQRRGDAIAAAKPDDVILIDAELLRARVSVEIATARAAASATQRAEAITASKEATAAVTQAARALIDAEMITLAHKFSQAFAFALKLGAQLEELSLCDHRPTSIGEASTLPAAVKKALALLPKRNPYDVPLNELRNGGGISHAWRARLDALTNERVSAL